MASKIVIPFDNNPVSTTVRSGSYTIPAGRYAKVRLGVGFWSLSLGTLSSNTTRTVTDAESCLLINSTVVAGYGGYVAFIARRTNEGTVTVTVQLKSFYEGHFVNRVSLGSNMQGTASILTDSNAVVSRTSNGVVTFSGAANQFGGTISTSQFFPSGQNDYECRVIYNRDTSEFWCPTGSVIQSPSGCSYIVELYNIVS